MGIKLLGVSQNAKSRPSTSSSISDNYGHDKGNIVLVNSSNLMRRIFQNSTIYRIGGDEFAIILRDFDCLHCEALAKDFEKRIDMLKKDDKLEPWKKITAAIGVAFIEPGEDMDSLFKRADQNMYRRKKEMKENK